MLRCRSYDKEDKKNGITGVVCHCSGAFNGCLRRFDLQGAECAGAEAEARAHGRRLFRRFSLIGFALGVRFQSFITSIDHWIAFVLLGLIGANMIRESREHDEENLSDSFSFGTMLPLAVATSIDALAVGVTFAFLQVSILPAVCFIGATTFVLSCIGIRIGHVFGLKYKSRAELFGGAVLILMGIKILLEHLGVLG